MLIIFKYVRNCSSIFSTNCFVSDYFNQYYSVTYRHSFKGLVPDVDFGRYAQPGTTNCYPCFKEYSTIKAEGFCAECVDYLCGPCCHHHNNNKASQHHHILRGHELPKDASFFKKIKELKTCQDHPKHAVEFRCFDHSSWMCSSCVIRSHKLCENVKAICDFDDTDHSVAELNVT